MLIIKRLLSWTNTKFIEKTQLYLLCKVKFCSSLLKLMRSNNFRPFCLNSCPKFRLIIKNFQLFLCFVYQKLTMFPWNRKLVYNHQVFKTSTNRNSLFLLEIHHINQRIFSLHNESRKFFKFWFVNIKDLSQESVHSVKGFTHLTCKGSSLNTIHSLFWVIFSNSTSLTYPLN